MRKLALLIVLASTLLSTACGTGAGKRLLTRPGDYAALIGFPSTGNPLDIKALEEEFPELKGIVVTAPEYLEEFIKIWDDLQARGEVMVPYKIPPGANISIEVLGEPDLSRAYYIPPTGYIDYPHIGEINVVGKTLRQFKANIRKLLSDFLKNPQVLVHLTSTPGTAGFETTSSGSYGRSGIYLFGAVQGSAQGGIPYGGGETIISVLGALGLSSNADWRQIRIIRRSDEDPWRKSRVIIVDMWNYFAHADVRQDIPLFPGDVIFVPKKLTLGDQFQKDWSLVRGFLGDIFFLDNFRDAAKKGGSLRP